MAYKCLECGHIFEEGEQITWAESHGFVDGPSQHMSGCPICCGAYEETVHCSVCLGEHLEDELFSGICEECLREAITYDNFRSYLLESEMLALFMFETVFETPVPDKVSQKLYDTLYEWFLRMKANERLCDKTDLLDLCRKFVMEGDGDFGKIEFADWLNERNGVKN